MATLTIPLDLQPAQAAFNQARWTELLADPALSRIEGRIETDRHGRILMSPPPAPRHGSYQLEIGHLLRTLMTHGRVVTECPVSTADGVKAADVAWASAERLAELGNRVCFPRAPEICVEVLSPGNTEGELREKIALYFGAGAQEVWLCSVTGAIQCLMGPDDQALNQSALCPAFPRQIELR